MHLRVLYAGCTELSKIYCPQVFAEVFGLFFAYLRKESKKINFLFDLNTTYLYICVKLLKTN